MTSIKQIEANRRNAQKSTGPRTEAGKQRASRNAIRHGLTAETVLCPLEDADDYQAFEQAVGAGFDAETAVARELILRVASLLWRLRRATSIETGLFQVGSTSAARQRPTHGSVVRIVRLPSNPLSNRMEGTRRERAQDILGDSSPNGSTQASNVQLLLTERFMAVADSNSAFERINRYELTLWHQLRQVLLALEGLSRSRKQVRVPRYAFRRLGPFAPNQASSEEL